jgi:hypothetical protein
MLSLQRLNENHLLKKDGEGEKMIFFQLFPVQIMLRRFSAWSPSFCNVEYCSGALDKQTMFVPKQTKNILAILNQDLKNK